MKRIFELRRPTGEHFSLRAGVNRIGRGPESDIRIDDPSVSTAHCEIDVGPDGTVLRDLGSTNGTFIGEQRVQMASLLINQAFRVADVEFFLAESMQGFTPSVPLQESRRRIDKEGWKALAIGFALALAVALVPLLAYILDVLRIVMHETGHTLAAWAFGYPTIPQMRSGGGLSVALSRPPIMVGLMMVGLGTAVHRTYHFKRLRILCIAAACAYLFCAFTPLRWIIITAMGHGAELILASVFLYRGISGKSILHPTERPLYAMTAFFVFGINLFFAGRLLANSEAQTEYQEGFDGQSHDLVRLAEECFGTELSSVALGYFAISACAPFAAFLYYRFVPRNGLKAILAC